MDGSCAGGPFGHSHRRGRIGRGAGDVAMTALLLGGRIAGGIVMMPLVVLAGVVWTGDSVCRTAEIHRVERRALYSLRLAWAET